MQLQSQLTAVWLLSMAFAVAFSSESWGEEFPYQVITSRSGVALRCGPGGSYYVTNNLPAGASLEVYQHLGDGWCAIRPTDESFSLIPSNQTQLAEGASLAEVTADKVVSWIGTSGEEPPQLLWQVQLEKGETVEISGIVRRESLSGEGKDLWYKIRPPAGEFRYVHVNDLTPTETATANLASAPSPLEQVRIEATSHEQPITAENVAAEKEFEQEPSQWRVQTNPRARQPGQDQEAAIAIVEPVNRSESSPQSQATDLEPATGEATSIEPDLILNDLEVNLSLLAAKPLASWDFSQFLDQLAQLEQANTTPQQRTRMVRFRQRLQKFLDLQEKQQGIATLPANRSTPQGMVAEVPSPPSESESIGAQPMSTPLATTDDSPAAPAQTSATGANSTEEIPAEYDGMGYLMPVISREQQAPPFALLDKNGKVLGFVSPVPGLNLRRYIKQEVGVIGQRGYLPKYQATHLTAQRIIVLERHR